MGVKVSSLRSWSRISSSFPKIQPGMLRCCRISMLQVCFSPSPGKPTWFLQDQLSAQASKEVRAGKGSCEGAHK